MITSEQVTQIGFCGKPHGIKGELTIILDSDCELSDLSCVILEIDGIFVPFFFESFRLKKKESYLVKFSGIESEVEANELSHLKLYALINEVGDEDFSDENLLYLEDLIGFKILDYGSNESIGCISDYDDSTENLLFEVENNSGSKYLIPATDDFIIDIDESNEIVIMQLPDGLINL